jgi:Tol biopolymer transport system component
MISVADGQRRKLTSPAQAASYADDIPAISPAGRTLAFVRRAAPPTGANVYLLSLNGSMPVGEARQLTRTGRGVYGLAWTSDGRELVFSSRDASGPIFVTGTVRARLWRISARASSKAAPELLAGVTEGAVNPAISRPGPGTPARLAYERQVIDTNIWGAELDESGHLRRGTTPVISSTRLDITPQISPDGRRIAFGSDRSGHYEIYLCDSDGRNVGQLTSTGLNARAPRWSPDGSKVAFDARGAGLADIYVIGVDGSRLTQLTSEPSDDVRPSWSKDGQWIYFRSSRSGTDQIWKIPAGGGPLVQITRNGAYDAFESPDGKLLYFVKSGDAPGLWSVPVDGGEETSVLGPVSQSYWAVADKGIFFLDLTAGVRALKPIKFFDFQTRKTRDIGSVQSPVVGDIPGFSVSPDGRRMVWLQVDQADSDLMLIDKFR